MLKTGFIQSGEQKTKKDLIAVFSYLMVVLQKTELESFQRGTVKGQGAEVTSYSKRNSNCMSEVKKYTQ